ncbi:MAG: VWA domain-containing protein, partial [Acidobacteriota bacterium]|nr:VWA domain-containing protein [Acidobacteriota bacterium]
RVKTDISGFLARVTVEQEFENNFNQPIEAVYTFPLSQNSAVDDMTMKIGSRTIRGTIKKREDARKIYEEAKTQGKTASLLDQERPNVFTQSVANILPNEKIIIEISYVETLKYEDGSYEFVFPMVVGPRYSPASIKAEDAAKVTPPVALETRAGHDISIEVNLDAGVPIENIFSTLHEINTQNLSSNSAKVELQDKNTIPNKDFILKYDVTGKRIEDAILTHRDKNGGFFTMMLSPPENFSVEDVSPKEIVFVLDTSGSMGGFPIEKAKEAMKLSLKGLYPNDTFNLITFAGDTHVLFDEPVPATQANLARAKAFLESRSGGGGTEMMKAIKAALKPSGSNEHLRIVNFMTDGYVSNESEIIAEIQKNPNARVFSFGIGNGVNRFLLDKMSAEGRGEVQYVTLEDDGSKAAKQFYERIRNPLLTDISIDWNGLPVADIYPKRNSDLFDAKPVVINGRYTKAASGTIKLKGKVGGQDYEREIKVNFPESETKHDVLATLWARMRIDDLMSQNYDFDSEEVKLNSEATKLITQMGLEFRLLTEFTSFVAVEEVIRTQGGKPVKIEVPVELADGTFGDEDEKYDSFSSGGGGGGGGQAMMLNTPATVNSVSVTTSDGKGSGSGIGTGEGSGIGSGSGSGIGDGTGNVSAVVNVTSGDSPVNTSSSSINTTITASKIENLPTNGRNFQSLLTIQPGVIANSKGGGFALNGARGSENSFVIDGSEVTNFRTGSSGNYPNPTFPIAAGAENNFNGTIITAKSPEYPNGTNLKGKVQVQIDVDEKGNVSNAKAISGNPALKQTAEKAASEWKFAPVEILGVPVKFSGELIFEFVDAKTINLAVDKMRALPLDENQKLKILASEKLHIWVFELFARLLDNDSKATANEARFVKSKTAYLQIQLTEKTSDVVSKIEKIGFDISSEKNGKTLIGKIKTEKIKDLIEIKQVKYILPSIK